MKRWKKFTTSQQNCRRFHLDPKFFSSRKCTHGSLTPSVKITQNTILACYITSDKPIFSCASCLISHACVCPPFCPSHAFQLCGDHILPLLLLPNSTYKAFGINYMYSITTYCPRKQGGQTKPLIEEVSMLKGQIITAMILATVPKLPMLNL